MKWIKISKTDIVLKTIESKEKIIIGISAEMNHVQINSKVGCGLVQASILPHYAGFLKRYDRFEEIACEYEIETGRGLYRINDGQAVFFYDSNVSIV
jgi:hypothetical protein